jgi:hypothetical protein
MLVYEGDPDGIKTILGHMPAEVADQAIEAYANYALRLHGTATPARLTG